MPTLETKVLVLFLTLGPHSKDTESFEERVLRGNTLAHAQVNAARVVTCTGRYKKPGCKRIYGGPTTSVLSALHTLGRYESWFAEHVHEGRCDVRNGECDAGLAKSPWQIHAYSGIPRSKWLQLEGEAYLPTARAAYAASRFYGVSFNACKTAEGAFTMYGTGKTCKARSEKKRAMFRARAATYNATLKRFSRPFTPKERALLARATKVLVRHGGPQTVTLAKAAPAGQKKAPLPSGERDKNNAVAPRSRTTRGQHERAEGRTD